MKKVTLPIILIALVSFGCGGSSATEPDSKTSILEITLDQNCRNEASNVEVYVDGDLLGYMQPGDSPLSKEVEIGNHEIYAVSREGTKWGVYTKYIPSNGLSLNLTCD